MGTTCARLTSGANTKDTNSKKDRTNGRKIECELVMVLGSLGITGIVADNEGM
jgi:hypothetical protein